MSATTGSMKMAEKQYAQAEERWQKSEFGQVEESDALCAMVDALHDMIAEQQKQIDALIAHAQRPLEMPS